MLRNSELHLRKWLLFSLLAISLLEISQSKSAMSIEHLEGEAGFRMASLQWKYPQPNQTSVSFRVRYCELHQWGLHRCRYQAVGDPEDENKTRRKVNSRTGRREGTVEAIGNDVFLIEIGGLRMATNYSFQVVPQDPGLESSGQPSQISLQTKGFSAKATKCLANSSEVLVETGPFFGGRISVDESERPGCFVQGDPLSPQTQYTLQIRHSDCGSVVNGSKVTTVILVQENVPILTHSTRKFILLCSFSPESFTVKAGVSLPRETNVAKALDFSRLIRISPQNTNLIVANKEQGEGNRGRPPPPLPLQGKVNNVQSLDDNHLQLNANLDNATTTTASVPKNLSRVSGSARQSRAYEGPGLAGQSSASSEQMLKQDQNDSGSSSGRSNGNWETYLVFGMICMAVVASLSSVGWFINSVSKSGLRSTERLNGDGDGESQLSSSSFGSLTSEFPKDPHRSSHNLDTRSELEVELDFEFSEERNPSPFHLQLDLQDQNQPSSQA